MVEIKEEIAILKQDVQLLKIQVKQQLQFNGLIRDIDKKSKENNYLCKQLKY